MLNSESLNQHSSPHNQNKPPEERVSGGQLKSMKEIILTLGSACL